MARCRVLCGAVVVPAVPYGVATSPCQLSLGSTPPAFLGRALPPGPLPVALWPAARPFEWRGNPLPALLLLVALCGASAKRAADALEPRATVTAVPPSYSSSCGRP